VSDAPVCTARDLVALAAELADVRIEGARDAFELSAGGWFSQRSRTLRARQVRFLEAVQRVRPPVFLAPPGDPVAAGAPGTWVAEGEGLWRLPTDVPAERLLEELLDEGNWFLLAGAAVAAVRIDPHRAPLAETHDFMRRNGLWLLVDAFHDGVSWRVFFAE
jgi:hypothetical protein